MSIGTITAKFWEYWDLVKDHTGNYWNNIDMSRGDEFILQTPNRTPIQAYTDVAQFGAHPAGAFAAGLWEYAQGYGHIVAQRVHIPMPGGGGPALTVNTNNPWFSGLAELWNRYIRQGLIAEGVASHEYLGTLPDAPGQRTRMADAYRQSQAAYHANGRRVSPTVLAPNGWRDLVGMMWDRGKQQLPGFGTGFSSDADVRAAERLLNDHNIGNQARVNLLREEAANLRSIQGTGVIGRPVAAIKRFLTRNFGPLLYLFTDNAEFSNMTTQSKVYHILERFLPRGLLSKIPLAQAGLMLYVVLGTLGLPKKWLIPLIGIDMAFQLARGDKSQVVRSLFESMVSNAIATALMVPPMVWGLGGISTAGLGLVGLPAMLITGGIWGVAMLGTGYIGYKIARFIGSYFQDDATTEFLNSGGTVDEGIDARELEEARERISRITGTPVEELETSPPSQPTAELVPGSAEGGLPFDPAQIAQLASAFQQQG